MTSSAQVIKSVFPKLVPFFKTLAIYFVVFIPNDQPSVLATILKCLPILALVVFIVLQTRSAGIETSYSKKIIGGLLFGCLGDALLIWPGYFEHGLVSFLIGHLLYIRALGLTPLNVPIGLLCGIVSILGSLFYVSNLHGFLIIGTPIYSLILMTTVWRAATRMQYSENPWTWSKICTCLGAISFAISDFMVGYEHFRYRFEYSQLLIMTTYYAGQFGFALSILDAKLESTIHNKEN